MKLDIKTAKLSVLKALALAIARDIDAGKTELRAMLEEIMSQIPRAAA